MVRLQSCLLIVLFLVVAPPPWQVSATAAAPPMRETGGQTMGTSYRVKLFAPPADLPEDWGQQIDRELRQVNDQMSTYLQSSEISRFNASDSTQWFAVSPQTATVVAAALEVHRQSDGAFDITVAPLVDAWSFGPGKRTGKPPEPSVIQELLERVGSDKLDVRLDPPAIRKLDPRVSVDLSAIAKGHGVDRVVVLLQRLGVEHCFVEIGGEIRALGDKAGQPWMVGLQKPDVAGEIVAVAHPLRDQAVATSGDYRNYFEFEGRRFSHTIDPRSGHPVDHALASVSVIADDCMTADAWATVIATLGPEQGLRLAQQLQLHTLLMVRDASGAATAVGTGQLQAVAAQAAEAQAAGVTERIRIKGEGFVMQDWLMIALFGAVVMAIVVGGMAIGVMFGRRAISGSCGGLANRQDADGKTSCSLCSNPSETCRELQEKAEAH